MNKRLVQFGKQPPKPEGMFREIHFPMLAELDTFTQEGMLRRYLSSEGGDARNLPRTIYMQTAQAPQHGGAVAVGALYEATLDADAGVLRDGKGWLVDLPVGHEAAVYVKSGALQHNSIDMAEIQMRVEPNFADESFPTLDVYFDRWKLAATTLVGKPAFADASAVIPDEIMASILEDDSPLVCDAPNVVNFVLAEEPEEVTAALTAAPPWEYFHRPEPQSHHKIVVGEPDANGWIPVYGHLGLWNTQHDGWDPAIKRVCIPRPHDNYASFNKAGVLTDRGQIETGPICLKGGHVSLAKALDSVENAWADVRVTAGIHGPWLCGVVRPGTSDEDVYTARASRISGHWKGGRLKAIVSVNAEGFDVPGTGFMFQTNPKGEVNELVASYPGDDEPAQTLPTPVLVQGPASVIEMLQTFTTNTANATTGFWTFTPNMTPIYDNGVATTTQPDVTFELEKERLLLQIDLDDEDDVA
jgi:hypothetical protein